MNILFVKDNTDLGNRIKEYLLNKGDNLMEIDEPFEPQEKYIASLLASASDCTPDYIISLGFYPVLSLASGALGIRYVSWIIDSAVDSVYDYSIKNEWNRILIADYNLYKFYEEYSNVSYLPLGYTISDDEDSDNDKPSKDVLIWTDVKSDTDTIGTIMDDLKDSSKGYIDSILEQRKNDLSSWSLYDLFADYIKNDIESTYPEIRDSLESVSHKYDRKYFYKLLERTYAFPYIQYMYIPWTNPISIDIATARKDELVKLPDDKTGIIEQTDIIKGGYSKLDEYKVIIYFTKISTGNMIPVDLWNIMARGNCVLFPRWIETDFRDNGEYITFKHKRGLRLSLSKLIDDKEKRDERKKNIREIVLEENSIMNRIEYMYYNVLCK